MLTAHLPGGYVSARIANVYAAAPFCAVLVGSVFPDLDLIWFYWIDDRAFHHHRYWVHIPGFWLIVAAVGVPMFKFIAPSFTPVLLAFFGGVAVHILLDSLAGSIAWLWPFDNRLFALFDVPASQSHWILSFLFHWTFVIELLIWRAAAMLWWRSR